MNDRPASADKQEAEETSTPLQTNAAGFEEAHKTPALLG
jgi:hypothetical protein